MSSQLEYGTVSSPEDAQQLGKLLSQCFGDSLTDWQPYFESIGQDNFRCIRQAGQVVGGLAIYFMGQWYGSQLVPMAGIAAVGIAPESRGTGAAYELMKGTLQELYDRGVPISTLYAATQVLYRKVGYEQGGSRCCWELSTQSIQIKDRHLPIQSITPVGYEAFQDLYSQQAQLNNGNLARHQALWKRVVESSNEQPIYAYLLGSENQPEGYVIFTQRQETGGLLIGIKDWVVLTPAAARRFWTFLADHRSQVSRVRWFSSPMDSLTLLLPEQTAKIHQQERWMLRIIDVPKALKKRGYPLSIDTELHLQVRDDLFPQNNSNFVFNVSAGRGEVTKGGKGEFCLDVRGLASLYTGLFTPHQLQLIGHLDATTEALSRATQLFSGSSPWMPDFF
ncbi:MULTISPECIES: GNAT family N-acetyltransferase [unclassified Coleofasciculus]|uniref:GNAT family N-acetyltransferase n=1 Tax=unclassified Coleofasciculus TaxID=2692782 RepID=UPI001880DF4F|nr:MULTISPECIES: GNAT family N-acetyltransferase [unclassified Coleofasciculus]MBE9126368.1 GNAT family N-acetyltransferase [Coleofasciculus sp. LEGE 07081]MBE9150021.1 GNAT family N-acetyltransferase [Coleofasciculus sp. LEGE 07092]